MKMDEPQALDAFDALSQVTRLRMVRALVKAGPQGMPAGAVGDAVGASSSSASFHLAHLERAGLIQSKREARSIIYSADYAGLSSLVEFLMRDCCGGHPEVCAPAVDALACCAPSPAAKEKVHA
jgi:DNA-binding transcriptional ArsR family regulator